MVERGELPHIRVANAIRVVVAYPRTDRRQGRTENLSNDDEQHPQATYRRVAEGVGCGTAAGHLPIARAVADPEYPAAANLLNGACVREAFRHAVP